MSCRDICLRSGDIRRRHLPESNEHVYLGQVLTGLDLVEDAKGMGRALRGAAPQMGTVACLGISRGSWPTVGLQIAYIWPTTGRRRRGRSRTVGVLV